LPCWGSARCGGNCKSDCPNHLQRPAGINRRAFAVPARRRWARASWVEYTAEARRRGGNEGFPMKVQSAGCGVRKGEYGGFAGARSPWWWGGGSRVSRPTFDHVKAAEDCRTPRRWRAGQATGTQPGTAAPQAKTSRKGASFWSAPVLRRFGGGSDSAKPEFQSGGSGYRSSAGFFVGCTADCSGRHESGRGLPHSTTLARRPGSGNAAGDGCMPRRRGAVMATA